MIGGPEGCSRRVLTDGGESEAARRKFTIRREDGTEHGSYSGSDPGKAAKKAARRLLDAEEYTDPGTARQENSTELYLREIGTYNLFPYRVWAWKRNPQCPECGGVQTAYRSTKNPPYRCSKCGSTFEELEPASGDHSEVPEFFDLENGVTEVGIKSLGSTKLPDDALQL